MKYLVIEDIENFDLACEYYSKKKILGLDTETSKGFSPAAKEDDAFEPRHGLLRLIQISDGEKTVVIDVFKLLHVIGIDVRKFSNTYELLYAHGGKIHALFSKLKKILENPEVKVVIHNAKFEEKWLSTTCGINLETIFDTFLVAQLLDYNSEKDPDRGHKLSTVMRRYVGVDLDKTEQKSDWSVWELTKDQHDYAALDVHYLPKLREAMVQEVVNEGLVKAVKLELDVAPVLASVELAGVKVNREKYRSEIHKLEELRTIAEAHLQKLVKKDEKPVQTSLFGLPEKDYNEVLLSSSSQMKEVFIEKGIPVFSKKEIETFERYRKEEEKLEKMSVNERLIVMKERYPKFNHNLYNKYKKALDEGQEIIQGTGKKAIASIKGNELVDSLKEFRGVEKMVTSFGENILNLLEDAGRMGERLYPNFYQIGAPTGRMSCNNPNVQQIPDKIIKVAGKEYELGFRDAFDFPEGYVGVNCITGDSLVATKRGLIPIKNVLEGDYAVQEDGSFRKIQRVLNQGIKPVYRITLDNGNYLDATSNHRIRVIDEFGNYVWRFVKDLKVGDFVPQSPMKTLGEYKKLPNISYTHYNNKVIDVPTVLNEEIAEVLGYLTGDGTFNGNYLGWVVNEQDEDLYQYITSKIRKIFNPKLIREARYRGVIEGKIFSKPLTGWLRQLINKEFVTDYILQSPDSVRKAFLRGYFEADGYVDKSRVSIASSRKQIISQIHSILSGLGISSRIDSTKTVINEKEFFGSSLTLFSEYRNLFIENIGFLSARKKKQGINSYKKSHNLGYQHLRDMCKQLESSACYNKTKNVRNLNRTLTLAVAQNLEKKSVDYLNINYFVNHGQVYRKIKSIEFLNEQETYDLTVEGTSTYLAKSFVCHNCDYSQIELRVVAEMSKDPIFIRVFVEGKDLHSDTASRIFDVPYEFCNDKNHEFYSIFRKPAKCFHPDVEVLTKNGWRKIKDVDTETEIIQAVPKKDHQVLLEWVKPTEVFTQKHISGKLIHLKNESIDLQVTPDHRMLAYGSTGKPYDTIPENFSKVRSFVNCGILEDGKDVDLRLLRIAVAVQADGSYSYRKIKFGFSKKEKVERLKGLLREDEYIEAIHKNGKNGFVTSICLSRELTSKIKAILNGKKLSWDMLSYSREAREAIVEEASFWDSHKWSSGLYRYTSIEKENVDILQAIAASVGKKSSISTYYPEGEKSSVKYDLSVKDRNYSRGENVETTEVIFTDEVSCLSVPSTYVLVRQNGKVVITGQSINFGIVYGIGAYALAGMIGKSEEEAQEMIDKYALAYPTLWKYLRSNYNFAIKNLYARTLSGRKQKFTPPSVDALGNVNRKEASMIGRNGMNMPIQGCLAGNVRIFVNGQGYKKIGEVAKEAKVVWDGQSLVKAFVTESGKKQLVKLKFNNGMSIDCSPEHKFYTYYHKEGYKWTEAGDLTKKHRVFLTEEVPHFDYLDFKDTKYLSKLDSTEIGFMAAVLYLFKDGVPYTQYELNREFKRILNKAGVQYKTAEKYVPYFDDRIVYTFNEDFIEEFSLIEVKEAFPESFWESKTLLKSFLQIIFNYSKIENKAFSFCRLSKDIEVLPDIQQALRLFNINSTIQTGLLQGSINIRKSDAIQFIRKIGIFDVANLKNVFEPADFAKIIYKPHPFKEARLLEKEVTEEFVEMFDVADSDTSQFMANGFITHNTAADILKRALKILHDNLKGLDARIVNIVHDEVMVECHESIAEMVREIVEVSMKKAGEEFLTKVPVVVDAHIVKSWGEK